MTTVRTLRPDPDHPGICIGWPRPLIPDPQSVPLPHAWISHLLITDPAPGVQLPKDACRGPEAIRSWRCQLCGERCSDDLAYAPVVNDGGTWPPVPGKPLTVSGGPLCTIRCVRLAQVVCPHLARCDTGIVSYTRADTHEDRSVHARMVITAWHMVEIRHTDHPAIAWTARRPKQRIRREVAAR